ncbi:MAG: hypothetical protein LBQ66_11345 [Planctomycetaceae bacterium]|jgi:hypothetical protein|nr:hypothetical protein [Planctomycetaceae bacterium]
MFGNLQSVRIQSVRIFFVVSCVVCFVSFCVVFAEPVHRFPSTEISFENSEQKNNYAQTGTQTTTKPQQSVRYIVPAATQDNNPNNTTPNNIKNDQSTPTPLPAQTQTLTTTPTPTPTPKLTPTQSPTPTQTQPTTLPRVTTNDPTENNSNSNNVTINPNPQNNNPEPINNPFEYKQPDDESRGFVPRNISALPAGIQVIGIMILNNKQSIAAIRIPKNINQKVNNQNNFEVYYVHEGDVIEVPNYLIPNRNQNTRRTENTNDILFLVVEKITSQHVEVRSRSNIADKHILR